MKATNEPRISWDIIRMPPLKPGLAGQPGLFAPSDIWWRMARERVILAGGPCALLLQVAHPLVAEGVYCHSDFARNPMSRLKATMGAILTASFGDLQQVEAISHRVHDRHSGVEGHLAQSAGPFAAGSRYSALDGELAKWVLATLVWSSQNTAELLIGPLSYEERSRHLTESLRFGILFGVRVEDWFEDWRAFSAYFEEIIAEVVDVGPKARYIADDIMGANFSASLRCLPPIFRSLTCVLLPSKIAALYEMQPAKIDHYVSKCIGLASRRALPVLPPSVRYWPHAKVAHERLCISRS